MFNVGGGEIMMILLLALLVLGPDKLPEYARKAGRYINEFRRMTSGFQEEFRQAIDLSDVTSPPAADTAAATVSEGDALDRTTEGPRLLPTFEAPTAPMAPPPPAPAAETPPPGPAAGGAFTADVTPAPGTGPELITPSGPTTDHEGDAGSSSAA